MSSRVQTRLFLLISTPILLIGCTAKLEKENADLRQQATSLQAALAESNQRTANLTTELAEKAANLAKADTNLAANKEALAKTEAINRELEAKNASLIESTQEYREMLAALRGEVGKAKADAESKTREHIVGLVKKIRELESAMSAGLSRQRYAEMVASMDAEISEAVGLIESKSLAGNLILYAEQHRLIAGLWNDISPSFRRDSPSMTFVPLGSPIIDRLKSAFPGIIDVFRKIDNSLIIDQGNVPDFWQFTALTWSKIQLEYDQNK